MTREERIEAMKNPKYAERKGFAVDKRISLKEVFVITNLTPEEYQWLCNAVEWILSDMIDELLSEIGTVYIGKDMTTVRIIRNEDELFVSLADEYRFTYYKEHYTLPVSWTPKRR